MRAFLVSVVVVSSLVGCRKEPSAPRASMPASPGSPTSTAEQDALWALAPKGATTGVVVSPRGLARLEGALHAILTFTASSPELAPAHEALARMLEDRFGTREPTLATMGMTADKGFAYFGAPGGALVVLPVTDRDRFASFVKDLLDADADFLNEYCKEVRGVYACSLGVDLATPGGGALREQLALVGARGDAELVRSEAARGRPVSAVAVLQLDRGAGVLRAAVQGFPVPLPRESRGRPRVHDTSTGFGMLDLMVLRDVAPALPLAPGVTLHDLARSVAGPLTATVSAGEEPVYEIVIPLSDTAVAQQLVERCDEIAGSQELGLTSRDGVCRGVIPRSSVSFDAWIEGDALRIGRKGTTSGRPVAPEAAPHLSAIAREIAGRDWLIALHGRGSLLAAPALPVDTTLLAQLPPAHIGFRALAMINELGLALRGEGDVIHVVAALRTAWSNPDDVIAKLGDISLRRAVDGTSFAAAKAIADAAPQSPFAGDLAAGFGGFIAETSVVGVLAAIAIPAFMDYMKRSKRTEASVSLERLAKSVKIAHLTYGELPKGSAPPSPERSCCEYPSGKCAEPAVWQHPIWKQLDFAMREPHLFRYAYDSDGTTFMVRAIGDLDCDGNEITYTLSGSLDDQGNITMHLLAPPPNSD